MVFYLKVELKISLFISFRFPSICGWFRIDDKFIVGENFYRSFDLFTTHSSCSKLSKFLCWFIIEASSFRYVLCFGLKVHGFSFLYLVCALFHDAEDWTLRIDGLRDLQSNVRKELLRMSLERVILLLKESLKRQWSREVTRNGFCVSAKATFAFILD